MFKNAMKSTSVLALCSALMVPPVIAQDAAIEDLETCTIAGPFPCVTEGGTKIENAMELAESKLLGEDAVKEDTAGAPSEPSEPATPVEPAAPSEAGDPVVTEDEAEAEVDATAEAEAGVDAPVEEDQGVVDDLAEQLEADEPVEEAPDAAADVTEETPAPEATAETSEEAPQDTTDEAVAPTEDAPADDMTAGERIEEDTSADTAQAPETQAPDEEKSLIENLADQLMGNDDADAETAAEIEAETPEVTTAPDIPETPVEDEAPEAEAAAVADDAAADEDMAADSDVVIEEVTEAETRSSGEEFDNKVSTSANAQARANGNANTEKEGTGFNRQLTDFEKLVLVGLGGVAVGTILANGNEIVSNSGDRIVVQNPDGTLSVLKNDDTILRQPGTVVSTRSYDDGSTRTVIERENGVRIVTVRAGDGTVLKRVRVLNDGTRIVLFDDTQAAKPVSNADVASYTPAPATTVSSSDEAALRTALMASMNNQTDRTFSLRQVRQYSQIRDLAPVIEVDEITFDTGSAVIKSAMAEQLSGLGLAIRDVIAEVPNAVFLIEGHTDTVGDASYNLALSDRRAESVALALTEYFDVPPENLITQGYGESDLKIAAAGDIRENRRANVRNITPLLQ